MAFLGKARKIDLRNLAQELGEEITEDLRIIDLKNLIEKNDAFEDEEFVKNVLETIVSTRLEEEKKQDELERLQLQIDAERMSGATPVQYALQSRVEIQRILPRFNAQEDNMSLFLMLFERQMKFLKIPEEMWVAHLIGVLPNDISKLIAREPEELSQNFPHIRSILLQRFKLTADKFRKLFSQHPKDEKCTWMDFYYEIRNYFEGWTSELNVTSFEQLKELIIANQMKTRCSSECKEHFLDVWETLISPVELANKLDAYDDLKSSNPRVPKKSYGKFKEEVKREKSEEVKPREDEKSSVRCYGCGTPGYIRPKCPTCSMNKSEEVRVNSIRMYTCFTTPTNVPLLDISILGAKGSVCADTGASRSVAGELVYNHLRKCGVDFKESQVTMSLADGQKATNKVLTTKVPIIIKGRTVITNLIILPHVKGNRTLLGIDFLHDAGIVLDIGKRNWHFNDNPRYKFRFAKEVDVPVVGDIPVVDVDMNSCVLLEEGKSLNKGQRSKCGSLLPDCDRIFQPGGGATPSIEPPYRRKQVYRKKYDKKRQDGNCLPGDKVWVTLHPISKAANQRTAKFMPRRDGPYEIMNQRSSATHEVANMNAPDVPLRVFHNSALRPSEDAIVASLPVASFRRGGRPPCCAGFSSGRRRNQRGSM